jgi:Na+-driven multidrug efflux pump
MNKLETNQEKTNCPEALKNAYSQEYPADCNPAREDFLNKPLGRLILKNTLPAVASMLFMAFYHMADAIMAPVTGQG